MQEHQGKVRLVHEDFPLDIHNRAFVASQASRCAGDQGKFWEYHRNLLTAQGSFDGTDLRMRAVALGLDKEAFATCLASGRHDAEIRASLERGQKLGVNSTPPFINAAACRRLPHEDFESVLNEGVVSLTRGETLQSRLGTRRPREVAKDCRRITAWVKDATELITSTAARTSSGSTTRNAEVTPAGPGPSPSTPRSSSTTSAAAASTSRSDPFLRHPQDPRRAACGAFQQAIAENDYRGAYRGVYPIKVNQQRHVVEELIDYGRPFNRASRRLGRSCWSAQQENPSADPVTAADRPSSVTAPAQKLPQGHHHGPRGELDTILRSSRELTCVR
jgi:hypothetical protein